MFRLPLLFARPYPYERKVAERVADFQGKMRGLAEKMRSGDLSYKDWVYRSRLAISGHVLDGAVLGAARSQGVAPSKVKMTVGDRRGMLQATTEQWRYFNKFAATVTAAKAAGTELTSAVDARAELYGGAIRGAYNSVYLAASAEQLPLRWVRHAMDSCATCIANEGRVATPAEWEGGGVWPAHGTLCDGRCRCELVRST